jgi:FkbM family methyltransferase
MIAVIKNDKFSCAYKQILLLLALKTYERMEGTCDLKRTTVSSLFDVPKGERFIDRLILFLLRSTYFGVRLSLRLVIGRKLRDKFFVQHGLDFPTFTYKLLKRIGLDRVLLLLIDMPKQGYKFFCRINRDDFLFMTNHESEIMEYFIPNEGETVVDVGAHIGLYSLIAAKRVGSSGKVIAIEPDPENFKILKKNILLNQLSNIEPLECAVYSAREKLKLFLPELDQGRTIFNTVMQERAGASSNFLEVEANTLDNILGSLQTTELSWIKIDVEGAELEVLKGAVNTLSSNKNITLVIEIHGIEIYREMIDYLETRKLKIIYEKSNEKGDWRHVIAKKSSL